MNTPNCCAYSNKIAPAILTLYFSREEFVFKICWANVKTQHFYLRFVNARTHTHAHTQSLTINITSSHTQQPTPSSQHPPVSVREIVAAARAWTGQTRIVVARCRKDERIFAAGKVLEEIGHRRDYLVHARSHLGLWWPTTAEVENDAF